MHDDQNSHFHLKIAKYRSYDISVFAEMHFLLRILLLYNMGSFLSQYIIDITEIGIVQGSY